MGNTNSSANNRTPNAPAPSRRSRSAAPPPSSSSPAPSPRIDSANQSQTPSQPSTTSPTSPAVSSPSDANGPSTHAVPVVVQPSARDRDREAARDREKESRKDREKRPHPSLRYKKKSLELPDLALALTPASSPGHVAGVSSQHIQQGPYRRPQPSSPIAIPTRPGQQPSSGPAANYQRTTANPGAGFGQHAQLTAAQERERQQLANVPPEQFLQGPAGSTPAARRGNPHIRGAPLQYNSTRSFANTHAQFASEQQGQQAQQRPEHQLKQSFVQRGHFQPEQVTTSLPLALRKAEMARVHEIYGPDDLDYGHGKVSVKRWSTEEKRPAQVKIVYRGAAKSVLLMRAGDDNWKGRQPMEFDEATGEWSTWVSLMPGTHHIRFVVDGSVVTSDDLPTAVDDQGSLANYVAVPISGYTPPSASFHPTTREQATSHGTTNSISAGGGASFFADSVDPKDIPPEVGEWTDRIPWQLECAAEEEEAWLTTGQAARSQPPQHPQAPLLPRHLEKLIMNQRPPGMSRTHGIGSSTNTSSGKSNSAALGLFNRNNAGGILPVTTASGTNLSANTSGQSNGESPVAPPAPQVPLYTKLTDTVMQLADDGSVLPVPSHVVLHHLGTSAIRNGVLAVADTVRYKKKYITTIYYKPT